MTLLKVDMVKAAVKTIKKIKPAMETKCSPRFVSNEYRPPGCSGAIGYSPFFRNKRYNGTTY